MDSGQEAEPEIRVLHDTPAGNVEWDGRPGFQIIEPD